MPRISCHRTLVGNDEEHQAMLDTRRTERLLEMLTHRVRVMTAGQLARMMFAGTQDALGNARRYLARLERHGLVKTRGAMAHPELVLTGPLGTVDRHTVHGPAFARIAWQAKRRWHKAPCPVTLVVAAERARALSGGVVGTRPLRAMELDHEIAVTSVYLHLAQHEPHKAACWIHEDELLYEARTSGRRLPWIPDAVLRSACQPQVIIEVVGRSYTPGKVRAICQQCAEEYLELW